LSRAKRLCSHLNQRLQDTSNVVPHTYLNGVRVKRSTLRGMYGKKIAVSPAGAQDLMRQNIRQRHPARERCRLSVPQTKRPLTTRQ